ncbi:MAG TPA: YihY/virulence factor BrkB family protein [Flavipsychrobacter sp.]|nr:YihY/virulence factor BrkB family protein [Flavipsychrobacter sp.]
MVAHIKSYFKVLKDAFSEFNLDNVTKLSASLAYYTVFSIGPLLLVIITVAGWFYDPQTISGYMHNEIAGLIGPQAARQIQATLQNLSQQNNKDLFGLVGILVLLFGATTVFAEIQSSINYIWSIRAKPKKGWLKYIRDRVLSFSLVVGIGFLMLVSLVVNAMMDALTSRLEFIFGDANIIFAKVLSTTLLFAVISFLFSVIYKVLPDAKISWKDAFIGSTFTSFLFLLGRVGIGYYLSTSDFDTYGAAAAIIIILTWVYYSAMILYFGAEFTKVYALEKGRGIEPYETAVFIVKREAKELPDEVKDPHHNPAHPDEYVQKK